MSEHIQLQAADGHTLDAYVAKPAGEPVAALVIIQEIFGVNGHIRDVADRYAKEGYLAIAPALFDRYERGVDLGYDEADREKAMSFMPKLNWDWFVADSEAAAEYGRKATGKKVGIVGYCLGGTVAWLASARLKLDAAVGYYGGGIPKMIHEKPKAPTMLHFGLKDHHIPKDAVDKVGEAYPDVQIFWYDADHAFNNDRRPSFAPEAAQLAKERTLAFLKVHLG
jgi:carboxymethylenebutenolidase